jgi:hypothetical protein
MCLLLVIYYIFHFCFFWIRVHVTVYIFIYKIRSVVIFITDEFFLAIWQMEWLPVANNYFIPKLTPRKYVLLVISAAVILPHPPLLPHIPL